jgi:hypothetical protein
MRIAVPARNPGATAFAVKNSATGGQYCPRKLGAAVHRQRSPYDDVDEMNKRFNAILVEADEIGYSRTAVYTVNCAPRVLFYGLKKFNA